MLCENPEFENPFDVKLIDFGLAIHLPPGMTINGISPYSAGQYSTEQAGSPGYVAPEVLSGQPYGTYY